MVVTGDSDYVVFWSTVVELWCNGSGGNNGNIGYIDSNNDDGSSNCKWYYDDDDNGNNNNDNIFVYDNYGGVVAMVLVVLGWYWYLVRMVNGKVVVRTP